MVKGIVFIAVFLTGIFCSSVTKAQNASSLRHHQLGIRISSQDAAVNQSISYKYFFNPSLAFEGLFSFGDPVAIGALLEKHTPFGSSPGLTYYYGGAAYVAFGGLRTFGLQAVGGLDYTFSSVPVNLSVDWKPEINITKEFDFEPAAVGLSVRFVF